MKRINARPADSLKIALAQLNPTVGDVAGNAEKVRRARDQAAAMGADLVAFPELFIAGYPPEDLVLKPAFQAACRSATEALARETVNGPALLVGEGDAEDERADEHRGRSRHGADRPARAGAAARHVAGRRVPARDHRRARRRDRRDGVVRP